MCNRASQTNSARHYVNFYKAKGSNLMKLENEPMYQAFGFDHPTLIMLTDENGERTIDYMQWGLLPPFNKTLDELIALSKHNLNARSETIWEKASFKYAVENHRCVMPAEGFFEYQTNGKDKQPFFIYPSDHTTFNFACIYAIHDLGEERKLKSFSIVTTKANELMAEIHNANEPRMPLILPLEDVDIWISRKTDRETLERLMKPFETNKMKAHPVSKRLAKLGNAREAMEEIQKNTDLFGN